MNPIRFTNLKQKKGTFWGWWWWWEAWVFDL